MAITVGQSSHRQRRHDACRSQTGHAPEHQPAAYFYRKLHGADANILILDNHDDFGGHARRNEFHQGGQMRLAWGGTVNMEYTRYSATAKELLDDLGIDIPRLLEDYSFNWRSSATGLQSATWFDQQSYGRDMLLPGVELRGTPPGDLAAQVERIPISEPARAALRLLVRSLIPRAFPGMAPGADPFDIVLAEPDYGRLDQAPSPARLRLSATAVHAENAAGGPGVAVHYVQGGEVLGVRGRHAILACYNNIIPSLCPQLPEAQKSALRLCIKRPLMVVNVALRNGLALQRSGISSAYLPGRLCQQVHLVTGINVGDYRPQWRSEDPCIVQFYGAVGAPQPEGLTISQQNQAGRALLLGMSFEDHEREVRTVMTGIWGASGFNPAEDILAITVNRWPHGYARDHLDLEDSAWNADPPPNVVGRQTFGNIAIANSDAGADAYTHTAFDQAWRAVNELPA